MPLARPRRERWSRPVCAAPARLALGSPPSQDAASRGDAGASSPRPSSQLCQLVSQSCWREGRGQIRHRSPALGEQQRRAGTWKTLRRIPTGPGPAEAFAAAGGEQSLSPGCKIQQAQQAGTNSCTRGRTAFCQSSGSAAIPEDFAEAPDTSAAPPGVRDASLHQNFGMTSPNFTYLEQAKRFGLQRHCKGCPRTHSRGQRGLTPQHLAPIAQSCSSAVTAEAPPGLS